MELKTASWAMRYISHGQVCNSFSAAGFYLKQARVKSIEKAHPDDSDHLVFDCDFRMGQKKASHENK